MTQESLFSPTQHGEQPSAALQARLLARRTDPVTSRDAAVRLVTSGRLGEQQALALSTVRALGPGTSWELAKGVNELHYLLARRLPELERLGLVRVQRDAAGNAVRREGSRVWECMPE